MTNAIISVVLLTDIAERTQDRLDNILWVILSGTVVVLCTFVVNLILKISKKQEVHGEIISLMSMSNMSKIELMEILIIKHCRFHPDDKDVLDPLLKSLKGVNARVAQKLDNSQHDERSKFTP